MLPDSFNPFFAEVQLHTTPFRGAEMGYPRLHGFHRMLTCARLADGPFHHPDKALHSRFDFYLKAQAGFPPHNCFSEYPTFPLQAPSFSVTLLP